MWGENVRKAVVTGATGAIGTALIQELIQNNVQVLIICREGSKRADNIPEHPLVKKSFGSLDGLESMQPDEADYDVFYHLAWEGTTGQARNDIYQQNRNVKYALDAVGLAKRFGCKTFIGVGSQAEYGRFEGVLKPDTPVHPDNSYGIGKLAAGLMTREYAHQLGMEHIWVRVVSIYGPNDGAQTMVMSTIAKLKSGETPALTKGEQMWDYLYSGDAARAFYLLGDRGVDGKTYVLGSGQARPLREYIEIIRDVINPNSELGFGLIPYGDRQVMHLCAGISAIEKDTGWEPRISFERGIQMIISEENNSNLPPFGKNTQKQRVVNI